MSRARWKGPYVNIKYLKKIEKKNKQPFIMSRNSEIIPKFLGLTFLIHDGKNYLELTINDTMVGHKFGEFISTRSKFVFKKKKLKK